jgi:ABC-type phosphate transport system substrate-binding protein
MKKAVILALACIFAMASAAHAGNIILIANKGVGASSLSKGDVQLIFLGKKTSWDDGKKITPVVLRSGRVHDQFLKANLDKSASQFDTFWKQMMFTGKGRPPKSVAGDADVVHFVSSTDGAVGYIDADTPHGDVKRIEIN